MRNGYIFEVYPHPHLVRKWLPTDGSGAPKLARLSQSDKKVYLIFVANFNGDHYYELLDGGDSVNSNRYVTFVQHAI